MDNVCLFLNLANDPTYVHICVTASSFMKKIKNREDKKHVLE